MLCKSLFSSADELSPHCNNHVKNPSCDNSLVAISKRFGFIYFFPLFIAHITTAIYLFLYLRAYHEA
jgi:hypothetical protein